MAKGRGFPGGMGMGGGVNMNMLRQAQKMQQDMQNFQEEFKNKEFSASSGGGMVTVTVNGEHKLTAVSIKPEAVDPEDVEMLCDMVMAATNEAMKLCDRENENGMKAITGGLSLGF